MLPATLVTFATFFLEFCSASPVYNMQPAFITTNIGSTGRNIRNLPCISRKNSQSGVCMFAIDCLKANGTHLGTCIDRFYFGSCCHIEPVHDLIENTIDNDVIPSRVPPYRVSSTTQKTTTTKPQEISNTTISILNKNKPTDVITTTERLDTTTTTKNTTAIETTSVKLSTTTTTTTTKRPSVTLTTTTTSKPEKQGATTVQSIKLSTFQSVDGTIPIETTTNKIVRTTSKVPKPVVTSKPISSRPKPTKPAAKPITTVTSFEKPQSRPTGRPKPTKTPPNVSKPTKTPVSGSKPTKTSRPNQRPSQKPATRPTQKPRPTRTTTTRPVRTTTTLKPAQTTRNPVATTVKPIRTPISTAKPTKRTTTTKPTTTTTTTKQPATTQKRVVTSPETTTRTSILTTIKPIVTTQISSTPEVITKKVAATTTPSNEVLVDKFNVTTLLETVNGNPATNEIEANKPAVPSPSRPEGTTNIPSLVTWNVPNGDRNITRPSTEEPNTTTDDWVPITTPDGWVLLPSVPANATNTPSKPETFTEKTNANQTSIPTIIIPTTAEATTFTKPSGILITKPIQTATTKPPNTDPGSKPYIPLESTLPSLPPVTETTNFVPLLNNTAPVLAETSTTPSLMTTGGFGTDTSTIVTTTLSSLASISTSPDTNLDLLEPKPLNMSDFTDVCGRRMFPEARIVGGEKASFGKWPWQISLRQWRTSTYLHKCGAALLNENWAITAAHCVDNVPPSDLLLRLGEHDLSTESEPHLHQERRVQIVASHPQFDPRTFEYDLALLRFYEPVNFQPNIIPVCVPKSDENFVGRTAYVTGWGRLYEDGPLPSVLQEVSVPIINNSVCESMYRNAGYIEHIPHIFICAGWRKGGFDSCEGDSGGPLVIQRDDKRFLLAGVISWGIGCAEPNQPGVYTRISEFRDWINQILQF